MSILGPLLVTFLLGFAAAILILRALISRNGSGAEGDDGSGCFLDSVIALAMIAIGIVVYFWLNGII